MASQPLSKRQASFQQSAQSNKLNQIRKQSQNNNGEENNSQSSYQQSLVQKYDSGNISLQEFGQLFPELFVKNKYGGTGSGTKVTQAYIQYRSSRGLSTTEAERSLPETSYAGAKGYGEKFKPSTQYLEGGYSSIYDTVSSQQGSRGVNGFFTQSNTVQRDFNPASQKDFLASSVKGPDTFITTQGEVTRQPFTPMKGGAVFTRTQTEKIASTKKNNSIDPVYSENTGLTPLGQMLIKERFVSRAIDDLESRFLRGAQINLENSPENEQGTKFVKGAGERGVFPVLRVLSEPQTNVPILFERGTSLITGLVTIEYAQGGPFDIKDLGTPQLALNKKKVGELYENIALDISTNPQEFAGGLVGGGIFDAGFTLPLVSFAARPIVNVSSRLRNAARGVEVGVVEGTTNYNVITRGNETFLLVPDIHSKLPSFPEIGDLPLNNLLKQTKAGSGESTQGLTFVQGSLTKAKSGDTFLLRQFVEHQRVRESPFYASPAAEVNNPLIVNTNKGSQIVLPKGTVVQVGSKQFASGLSESGYEGIEFGLFKEKAVGVLTNEKISRVSKSKDVFEYRRRFFSPKYSGKATIQFSNEFPTTLERQYGFQTQGVKYFDSRGSTLKILDEPSIKADIFNRKPLPFGLDKKSPGLQLLYEDVGFGREYKAVELLRGKIGVPVGRPPIKDFEGKAIYERPTARAVVEDSAGKLLFVQEGSQPFLFPGGGVEPINVPGQGKEGIRLAYPKLKDYGKTAARELQEETGAIVLKTTPIKGIKIPSRVKDLSSTIIRNGKPVPIFRFKDITRFYKVDAVPSFTPKGEIDRILRLSPTEALSRSDVGSVEKEFIRRYYVKKKPSGKLIETVITNKDLRKTQSVSTVSYSAPRRISFEENPVGVRTLLPKASTESEKLYENGSRRSTKEFNQSYKLFSKSYSPVREEGRKELIRFSTYGYKERENTIDKILERPRNPSEPSSPRYNYSSARYPERPNYPPDYPERPNYPKSPPGFEDQRRKLKGPSNSFKALNRLIGAAYGVVTKKGGKEVLLPGRYIASEVYSAGALNTNATLRASFRIVPLGGYATRKGIVRSELTFTRSKRDPRFLVEPVSRRLSTRSEVKEIQASKRLRRLL